MTCHFERLGHFGASGAVLVLRGDSVLFSTGFGWADRDRRIPMTVSTGVDIASMSKDLTAVAILRLVERGELRLTDSLSAHLDSVPDDKRAITIAQLLAHRSGLPSFFVDGNDFVRLTRAQAQHAILNIPLEFAPGNDEGYSDAGYVLLAIIAERRTSKPIETILADDQFAVAGLTGTYSYGTAGLRASSTIAHGYVDDRDEGSASSYVADGDHWVIKGAGGIVSTAEDIGRWERALASDRLISAQSVRRLWSAVEADSALSGPPPRLPSGRRAFVRTGAQDFGFSAGVLRYVDDGTIAIIAVNRQPEAMDISYIRTRLLRDLDAFVSGATPEPPPASVAGAVDAASLAGDYRFADGSSLRLVPTADGVVAMPDGPMAVELVSYSGDEAGRAERLALASRSAQVLQQLCRGDTEPLRASLARPSERIEAYLRSTVCKDSTANIRAIGTVPRWWGLAPVRSPATLIEVTTASDTSRLRFEWEQGKISAVGGGGILAPVLRLQKGSAPSEFVAYHLGIGAGVSIRIEGRGASSRLLVGAVTGRRERAVRQ